MCRSANKYMENPIRITVATGFPPQRNTWQERDAAGPFRNLLDVTAPHLFALSRGSVRPFRNRNRSGP